MKPFFPFVLFSLTAFGQSPSLHDTLNDSVNTLDQTYADTPKLPSRSLEFTQIILQASLPALGEFISEHAKAEAPTSMWNAALQAAVEQRNPGFVQRILDALEANSGYSGIDLTLALKLAENDRESENQRQIVLALRSASNEQLELKNLDSSSTRTVKKAP